MNEKESWQDTAARIDQLVAQGLEAEEVTPIKANVSRTSETVLSIRMSYEDMALLRRYTKHKGIKMSEFVRDAMMNAMAEDGEDALAGLVAGAQQLAKLARKVEISEEKHQNR